MGSFFRNISDAIDRFHATKATDSVRPHPQMWTLGSTAREAGIRATGNEIRTTFARGTRMLLFRVCPNWFGLTSNTTGGRVRPSVRVARRPRIIGIRFSVRLRFGMRAAVYELCYPLVVIFFIDPLGSATYERYRITPVFSRRRETTGPIDQGGPAWAP